MAYSNELKQRARDYFEIHGKKLKEISAIVKVPESTLSEWKNDTTQPSGVWVKGRLKGRVDEESQKMNDELRNSQAFKELEQNLIKEFRIARYNACGQYIIKESEDTRIARQRAETIILQAMSQDYLDAKAHDGLEVADQILQDMKKNPELAKMSDVKSYVEIIKTIKEMRFGKSPDTLILNQNGNGEWSAEAMAVMDSEKLRQLIAEKKKKETLVEAKALQEDALTPSSQ